MKLLRFIIILFYIVTGVAFAQQKENAALLKYASYFNKELKSWKNTFRHFKLADFKKSSSLQFENTDFYDEESAKEMMSIYKPSLTYSPDKLKLIDIYSAQLSLQKIGNKIISHGGEPNQAIILFNNLSEGKRIWFLGPSGNIEEVLWLSNNKFLFVGYFDKRPLICIGDIPENEFSIYESSDKNCKQIKPYNSPKLKRLNIKEE